MKRLTSNLNAYDLLNLQRSLTNPDLLAAARAQKKVSLHDKSLATWIDFVVIRIRYYSARRGGYRF